MMERFDINGDGSISIEELGLGLKSIGVKISEKEKLALMKELDKDRDGGISEQEFHNALKSSDYKPKNKQSPFGATPASNGSGSPFPGF